MEFRNFYKKKSTVFTLLALVATAAFARLWGPFIVTGISYKDDKELSFPNAGRAPALVMNYSVKNIKRGDMVRIIYPDGSIYDFEVMANCLPEVSVGCTYVKATPASSATAKPPVSSLKIKDAEGNRKYACMEKEVTRSFPTGYWNTVSTDNGQVTTISSEWVSTGYQSVSFTMYVNDSKYCR